MDRILLILRTAINNIYPLALIFTMTNFKCRRRYAFLTAGFIGILALFTDVFLRFHWGEVTLMRYFTLVLAVPSITTLLFMAKDRPSQIFFHFFTAINMLYMSSIIGHITGSADYLPYDVIIRALFYTLTIYLFHRFLAKPYRFLALHMKRGWIMIAAIPFLFYLLVMAMGLYPVLWSDHIYLFFIVYVILCCVYYIIYQTFRNTYDLLHQRETDRLLSCQLAMQKEQMSILEKNNEKIRLLRHDMRHFIENIGICLEDGRNQDALAFLNNYKDLFHQADLKRYCENPVINSLISRYVEKAEQEGISVETRLDIRQKPPVDSMELAIVLSNALENSLIALKKAGPENKRRLIIRSVTDASFGLEIANTCYEKVDFNSDGYPVANEDGHGYGIQSIIAFAEKHRAIVDYELKNNMFRMIMLIQEIT